MATPHSHLSSSKQTAPSPVEPNVADDASIEPTGEQAHFGTTDTRVDPPHAIAKPHDASAADAAPFSSPLQNLEENDDFDPSALDTLRNQARQLSLLLSERQEALDRREAEWQRQLAHHETEIRSTRLWFDQRQAELDEREAGLAAREQELETRFTQQRDTASALEVLRAEHETAVATRTAELDARETELEERATQYAMEAAAQRGVVQELDSRREELRRELVEIRQVQEANLSELQQAHEELQRTRESSYAELQHERETTTAALQAERDEIERLRNAPSEYQLRMQAELDERETNLDRRETESVTIELRVRQALIEVERMQAELYEERERQAAQQKHDRLEMAEQRRRLEQDAAEKQKLLERQNEQLDFRRAAVKQEQNDLAEAQRETLEMRLVVEELWTQLSGVVPPAALTENVARLRNRLAEQYRMQQHELAAQRAELITLRNDLAAESDKLRLQTAELQRWAEARHEEIERQASYLTAREQELERQDSELAQRTSQWRQDRGRLELEVRRLESELRAVGIDVTPIVRPEETRRAAAMR